MKPLKRAGSPKNYSFWFLACAPAWRRRPGGAGLAARPPSLAGKADLSKQNCPRNTATKKFRLLIRRSVSTYLVFQNEGGGESTSMVLKGRVEVGAGWKGKGRARMRLRLSSLEPLVLLVIICRDNILLYGACLLSLLLSRSCSIGASTYLCTY